MFILQHLIENVNTKTTSTFRCLKFQFPFDRNNQTPPLHLYLQRSSTCRRHKSHMHCFERCTNLSVCFTFHTFKRIVNGVFRDQTRSFLSFSTICLELEFHSFFSENHRVVCRNRLIPISFDFFFNLELMFRQSMQCRCRLERRLERRRSSQTPNVCVQSKYRNRNI